MTDFWIPVWLIKSNSLVNNLPLYSKNNKNYFESTYVHPRYYLEGDRPSQTDKYKHFIKKNKALTQYQISLTNTIKCTRHITILIEKQLNLVSQKSENGISLIMSRLASTSPLCISIYSTQRFCKNYLYEQ
jgi:hypothetical protein